jgi:NitT/TauT family transport system substrate-binding protein
MPMKTYSRRRAILSGVAAATMLRARRAGAQTPATLRVSASINDTQAAAHFAEIGGFYKAAGLNVEITDFVSTGAIVSAVVGGAIDLAIATPITIVAAREQGIPAAIVAPGALYKDGPRRRS